MGWGRMSGAMGGIGPLEMHEGEGGVGALRVIYLHAEEREAGEDAEERAERTENAAPEPRDEAIHEQCGDEQKSDEPSLVKIELLRLPDRLRQEVLRVVRNELDVALVQVGSQRQAV